MADPHPESVVPKSMLVTDSPADRLTWEVGAYQLTSRKAPAGEPIVHSPPETTQRAAEAEDEMLGILDESFSQSRLRILIWKVGVGVGG